MIRTTAVAAISIGIVAVTDAVLFAGDTPVRFAQAADVDHSHHQPAAAGNAHQHGDATDGSVRVALQTNPESLQAGTRAELVFALSDSSGQPIDALLTHHGRKLHVVIVSDDMDVLGHIHPQDFGESVEQGSAKVFFTFPYAGRYLVAVDFMTEANGSQDEQFIVEVAGAPAGPAPETAARPGMVSVELEEDDRYTEPALLQDVDASHAYAVSLQQPDAIRADEEVSFAYHFTKDGQPVTDLRPYLDAPLHLAVVKEDLTAFLHTHGTLSGDAHTGHGDHGSTEAAHGHAGTGPDGFGPAVAATVTFPEPGTYHLFAQAAHGDTLLISRFPVHVE